jgi:hypothetical protein
MANDELKRLEHLVADMRNDRELLERVAIDLALTPVGDWDALVERVKARGYTVEAEELRQALVPKVDEPDQLLVRWASA